VKKQQSVAVVRAEVETDSDSSVDVVTLQFQMCIYRREREWNDVSSLTHTHTEYELVNAIFNLQ